MTVHLRGFGIGVAVFASGTGGAGHLPGQGVFASGARRLGIGLGAAEARRAGHTCSRALRAYLRGGTGTAGADGSLAGVGVFCARRTWIGRVAITAETHNVPVY